jgi:hypothetical protein
MGSPQLRRESGIGPKMAGFADCALITNFGLQLETPPETR